MCYFSLFQCVTDYKMKNFQKLRINISISKRALFGDDIRFLKLFFFKLQQKNKWFCRKLFRGFFRYFHLTFQLGKMSILMN